MEKRILFVCRYNRFRSVMAEAFFNKLNKNKKIKAKSAAPIRGMPLSNNVKKLAKEYNIRIKKIPQGLTSKLMKWQNLTIIVANDVSPGLFDRNKEYGKGVIIWNIPDVESDTIEEMKNISNRIKSKVKDLVNKLK